MIGSVSCTKKEFEETIDFIANKIINVEKYVTNIWPLEQLQQAFKKQISATEHMLKSILRP